MKKYIGILSILLILTIGIATAQTDPTQSKANGTVLYNYITNESNYKQWQLWPGTTQLYPGKPPHGAFLTTYVSDDAFSSLEAKEGSLPDGSIIVKENYMPDKTLAALTVMYKEAGYDPQNNDWFWAKYAPNGTVQAEGKIAGCITCHIQPKAQFGNQVNDYVFTSNLQGDANSTATTTETPTETSTETPVTTTEEPTTTTENPTTTSTPTKSPGFEGILGIIGLVSVIYLLKKKNR